MAAVLFDPETESPSNEVMIWDAATGNRLRTLVGEGPVADLAFSPRGRDLLDLGERLIFGGSGAVFSPAGVFEPGRYLAVIIDDDQAVEIYDMVSRDLVASTIELAAHDPIALAFDPAGRDLAIGTQDGGASVLDLQQLVDGAPAGEALMFDEIVDTGGVPGWPSTRRVCWRPRRSTRSACGTFTAAASSTSSPSRSTHRRSPLSAPRAITCSTPTPIPSPATCSVSSPSTPDQLTELAESRITRGLTDDECQRYELATCG